jgi:5-methylcytosine-specific restriction endonuclease McrA
VSYIPRKLRSRLAAQADQRCGYCQTQEVISGVPLTVEHIIPVALGGSNKEDNLWLSCRLYNEAKGILMEVEDSETKQVVPLFNPRVQAWSDHFRWNESGTEIIGQTAIGRATLSALSLNSELRVRSRAIWVEAGWHPPASRQAD